VSPVRTDRTSLVQCQYCRHIANDNWIKRGKISGKESHLKDVNSRHLTFALRCPQRELEKLCYKLVSNLLKFKCEYFTHFVSLYDFHRLSLYSSTVIHYRSWVTELDSSFTERWRRELQNKRCYYLETTFIRKVRGCNIGCRVGNSLRLQNDRLFEADPATMCT